MYNEICPSNSVQHVVEKGDTFWRISQTYGVSFQSVIDANPNVDPQNLQIGSTICIPMMSAPPIQSSPQATFTRPTVCPEGTIPHTVQAGDTFWRLSQTYGVGLQSIINANPNVDPQNLQIGSTICIPVMSAPPIQSSPQATLTRPAVCLEGTRPHTVQAGDTFWRLSQTYGVSLQSIINANPNVDPQNLQIGSTICIPMMSAPTSPPAMPILPTPPSMPMQSSSPIMPIMPIPPSMRMQSSSPSMPIPRTPQVTFTRPVMCPDGTFPYTVQEGDTFWRLSQAYGVSLQSIIDSNPSVDPLNLQIGSSICIPMASATPASPSNFAYLIKECDSICGIAKKFYVSMDSILQMNPTIDPRCLQAGTYIFVPINCCGKNTFRYTVRAGDTLNGIANKFNVDPSALAEANPNIDFHRLVVCQIICIPSA